MHGPFVNINGTSREALVKQASDVIDAAKALLDALGQACPHGRDYQTAPVGSCNLDRRQWEQWVAHVAHIHTTYRQIGERLVTEGLKDK